MLVGVTQHRRPRDLGGVFNRISSLDRLGTYTQRTPTDQSTHQMMQRGQPILTNLSPSALSVSLLGPETGKANTTQQAVTAGDVCRAI